jgi:hypothetical protein
VTVIEGDEEMVNDALDEDDNVSVAEEHDVCVVVHVGVPDDDILGVGVRDDVSEELMLGERVPVGVRV